MKTKISHAVIGAILSGGLICGCGRNPVESAIREIEQGHLENAEKLLVQILQEDPANLNALMNLYIIQLKNGQQDSALAGFKQVAEQAVNDPRPLEFAASILMDNNRWAEAASFLTEAGQRDPRSPSIQTALALVDLNTSGALAARTRLMQIITEYPTYAPALFNLGVINRDWLKNQNESKKYFQRYLAIEKNDSHVVIARAALSEKVRPSPPPGSAPQPAATGSTILKRPPPAESAKRDPKGASESFAKGLQHHQSHEYESAIEAYTSAVQLDPSMVRAHYNLGLLLRDKRNLPQARAEFEQALTYAPGMDDARYMLALVMIDQGHGDEAVEQLNAVLARNPKHAEAHLALGLLYKKDPAKRDLAKKELGTYLKLDPNGTAAREIRNWLKYLQ